MAQEIDRMFVEVSTVIPTPYYSVVTKGALNTKT